MNPIQIPARTRGALPARLREQISLTLQTLLTLTIIVWVLNLPAKAGFNLYTEQFLLTVLGFGFALSYLLIRARGGAENQGPTPWWDALAGFAGLAACLYLAVFYPTIVNEVVNRPLDAVLISALLFLLVIEATRRCAGMTLVIVIGVLVAYALLGDLLPGQFVSRPVQFTRLLVYLGLDSNAMIGSSLAIASIVVVPFILMGQVLSRCGGGDFFADLAMALMGRYRGGSAKISVVGSALFGMISGSAVSNVAAVGVITIPMMKRSGFKPHVAAAIEAVGSTGGQLAPPVMGAAAFLMAELLQVPYSAVLVAAVIPAFLYYLALFIQVDLEAAKMGIAGEPMDRLPAVREVLRHGWYFPIPFIVLVVGMMNFNVAAEYAALQAALLFVILNMLFGYRGKRVPLSEMFRTIVSTGKASVDILMICAASGLVIGILNLTGLAFGLTLQLLALSGDSLALLLLMTATVGIVLGMGMPTVGVYILLATLVAPALIKAGVSPMAAHMFVMYFGMMSMVTPPVAMAAFAAANLAQCDPSKAGWTATRIGWCSYLVPFMFVVSPSLLMVGPASSIIWAVLAASLGIFVGTVAMVGYFLHPLGIIERILFMVAGILMLVPADAFEGAIYTDIGGLVLVLALTARHWSRRPRAALA
ncbi:MAG: TRAP transporter fused permease subunit [Pseudomonadota bacterium]